ncbi:MAG: hypothetical protein DLM70_00605 [Chloroflexi bacterium]|nr:MAG: hypothetical protein DLM70_00605 [Chloroflexota bacterium]
MNDFTNAEWREIVAYFDARCAYCGERAETMHREHMIPLIRGGDHTAANIVPACPSCNLRKSTKTLIEWLAIQ